MAGAKLKHKQKTVQYALRLIVFLCSAVLPLFSSQIVHADTNDVQDVIIQNKIATDDNNSTSTIMPLAAVTAADPTDIASGTFGNCDWNIDATGKLSITKQAGNVSGLLGTIKYDRDRPVDLPWQDYIAQITSVYVDENIMASNDASDIFSTIPNVTTIDVSNLNVKYATKFLRMFANDPKLTSIVGLGNWDLASAEDMQQLFSGDTLLTDVKGIGNWNLSNVNSLHGLFLRVKKINIEELSNWDTSHVRDISAIFEETNITDFSPIENWDVSNVTDFRYAFYLNPFVTKIDVSKWRTNSAGPLDGMFEDCSSLTEIIGLEYFDTSNVTSLTNLFMDSSKITSLSGIENWDTSNVISMSATFRGCSGLKYLDLSHWNTSNVTTMSSMFSNNYNLNEDILQGLDKFDTHNVTNMSNMFYATGFKVLDLTNFNTSNLSNMGSMFGYTNNLEQIIGNFDTSSVTSMQETFKQSNISNFDGFNMDKWNVSSVTIMSGMFWGIPAKSVDFVSNWDTSNVKSFYAMFNSMPNLDTLDISNFDTTNATDVQYMFGGDKSLWKLTLGPKSVLTNLTGPVQATDVHLLAPVPGTAIKDDSTDGSYSAISDKWQVVDTASGGTDHAPLGDLVSAQDIIDKFSTVGNPVTTYVWQQQLKGDMKMTVPDIDFGTTSNSSGLVRRKSDFAIDVTNNTYPTDAVPSDLSVSMDAPLTDETDKSKTLTDVLVFKDKSNNESILSSEDTKIYSGDIANGSNTISWDDDHGILLDMNHDRYAENGHYSTTLKWTLTNSI
ncbi:BspA family leucine-rich repeat surface protein [Companilactobacillus muriivasis]|uniref:BspA family leucine-rich repeat surface protein n=1 Tax=Companilactobacillus muriivasis TaxID=3081444 RepID=UPI0030C6F7E0